VAIALFSKDVGKILSFNNIPKTPIALRATIKAKSRIIASSLVRHIATNVTKSSKSRLKRALQIHNLILSSLIKKTKLKNKGYINKIQEQIQIDIDTDTNIDQSSPLESLLARASKRLLEISLSAILSNSTLIVTKAKSK